MIGRPKTVLRPNVLGDGVRFILMGLLNTGLTVLVYQAALYAMAPSFAYALAWVVGLVFVYVVYPARVFIGGRTDRRSKTILVLNYVVGFLIGLAVVNLTIRFLGLERLAIFVSVGVTTVYGFFSSRWILRREKKGD